VNKGVEAIRMLIQTIGLEDVSKATSPLGVIMRMLPVSSINDLLNQAEKDEELSRKLEEWVEKVKQL